CGSAAAEAVDLAFELLDTRDHKIIAPAVGVLRAAGPSATPRILTRALTAKPAVRVSAFIALDHPDMWTAAVLADPATLPALLDLVKYSEVFPRVVEPLGRYGPAAAPALPTLLRAAAVDHPDIRPRVRAALDRIRPGWMTDPALMEHIAYLVYPVSKLPPAEAAEFYAAFGEVPPASAGYVMTEVRLQLDRVDHSFPRTANWTREYSGQYARALDPVFVPIERLGPKGKALGPHLRVWVRNNELRRDDPGAAIVNERLQQTLAAVGG
ncbi:MAG TPA: hypothetical protein VD866_32140, partial [Urbifossiella sp.]|nr:hypothetical protein [Urbifossiella sp.]